MIESIITCLASLDFSCGCWVTIFSFEARQQSPRRVGSGLSVTECEMKVR